ncbi:hypothetical protein [Robertkochia solimangrovi]|uniref:hypothetical protein n=1 Tax=Robertkochia solimangrovi TaxID=2213046 RepID=UPI00117C1174|nr:hypothetical protein [Robertkochia solimangrovi]
MKTLKPRLILNGLLIKQIRTDTDLLKNGLSCKPQDFSFSFFRKYTVGKINLYPSVISKVPTIAEGKEREVKKINQQNKHHLYNPGIVITILPRYLKHYLQNFRPGYYNFMVISR